MCFVSQKWKLFYRLSVTLIFLDGHVLVNLAKVRVIFIGELCKCQSIEYWLMIIILHREDNIIVINRSNCRDCCNIVFVDMEDESARTISNGSDLKRALNPQT